jgi:hypothetical protein
MLKSLRSNDEDKRKEASLTLKNEKRLFDSYFTASTRVMQLISVFWLKNGINAPAGILRAGHLAF